MVDDYRQWLLEAHQASSQAFDKAIMTLSGGALGLSLTFIHEIAPHPNEEWLLQACWSLLSFSLLLIVASFLVSEQTFWEAITARDAKASPPARWVQATAILNRLSGGSFIGGVAFLVAFAVYNL